MINWRRALVGDRGLARDWPRITVPTRVIWGEADAALGLETLDGLESCVAIPALRRLPAVSRWVQLAASEAVDAILAEWLAPVVADPASQT